MAVLAEKRRLCKNWRMVNSGWRMSHPPCQADSTEAIQHGAGQKVLEVLDENGAAFFADARTDAAASRPFL